MNETSVEPITNRGDRGEFERDFSRVLYSNAFRRLHNKTQVFPMPLNDHVHSRLTHSLEVADFGKNLGNIVGKALVQRHSPLKNHSKWDFGYIVSAACLAHDIGNPPFGHQGEDAISTYFLTKGSKYLEGLSDQEVADLKCFEGNAQGFRILCKKSERLDRGGMRLTPATLGAYAKYPQCSLSVAKESGAASRKKYGFFASEQRAFQSVAESLQLHKRDIPEGPSWVRHPLAFLTEAADDICYTILDLEDGFNLNLVTFDEFSTVVGAIAETKKVQIREKNSNEEEVCYLRARAMGVLCDETVSLFLDNEQAMLDGRYDKHLVSDIPSASKVKDLRELAGSNCYRASSVVQTEVAGYTVVDGLLEHITSCLFDPQKRKQLWNDDYPDESVGKAEKLRWSIDYVSGMTDRYAVNLYRHIKGMSLPEL